MRRYETSTRAMAGRPLSSRTATRCSPRTFTLAIASVIASDTLWDLLRRFTKLGKRPVGGIAFGDGELQGHAGLGFLDAEGERVHVDPLPAERHHLLAAQAGVEPEPQPVADRRVAALCSLRPAR